MQNSSKTRKILHNSANSKIVRYFYAFSSLKRIYEIITIFFGAHPIRLFVCRIYEFIQYLFSFHIAFSFGHSFHQKKKKSSLVAMNVRQLKEMNSISWLK